MVGYSEAERNLEACDYTYSSLGQNRILFFEALKIKTEQDYNGNNRNIE